MVQSVVTADEMYQALCNGREAVKTTVHYAWESRLKRSSIDPAVGIEFTPEMLISNTPLMEKGLSF